MKVTVIWKKNYGCSSFHRMQVHFLTSFSLAICSANFGSLGVISDELRGKSAPGSVPLLSLILTPEIWHQLQ